MRDLLYYPLALVHRWPVYAAMLVVLLLGSAVFCAGRASAQEVYKGPSRVPAARDGATVYWWQYPGATLERRTFDADCRPWGPTGTTTRPLDVAAFRCRYGWTPDLVGFGFQPDAYEGGGGAVSARLVSLGIDPNTASIEERVDASALYLNSRTGGGGSTGGGVCPSQYGYAPGPIPAASAFDRVREVQEGSANFPANQCCQKLNGRLLYATPSCFAAPSTPSPDPTPDPTPEPEPPPTAHPVDECAGWFEALIAAAERARACYRPGVPSTGSLEGRH